MISPTFLMLNVNFLNKCGKKMNNFLENSNFMDKTPSFINIIFVFNVT
jgi:hypothetical protein